MFYILLSDCKLILDHVYLWDNGKMNVMDSPEAVQY